MEVLVHAVIREAPDLHSWDLRSPNDQELPAFTAGAHIDLHLPNGMQRSYSLVNPQTERHRYVIAVQKEINGRGGSRCLHESVHTGNLIRVSAPRNNFPLVENAEHTILIAGGIGITPLLCMVHRLRHLQRPWQLYYAARSRRHAAFVDTVRDFGSMEQVHIHLDEECGGKLLDLHAVVSAAPKEAHFYCCGPLPMLTVFEQVTAGLPPSNVHVESFTARQPPASGGGYVVRLARSGREIRVDKGQTILATLLEAGFDLPHSCLEGVCGACETKVVDGVPDHRDSILSTSERESGKTMMICCSGSRSECLVLDL